MKKKHINTKKHTANITTLPTGHTLTGYSGPILQRGQENKSVLQTSPPNSLGSDKNKCFSLEWWHPGYFLVDLELITVKLFFRE